jgi:hypothetical protein
MAQMGHLFNAVLIVWGLLCVGVDLSGAVGPISGTTANAARVVGCRTLTPADCGGMRQIHTSGPQHSTLPRHRTQSSSEVTRVVEGCGAVIAAAVQSCSDAGGGTVSLVAGDFPLVSGAELVPSINLMNASNVVIAGSDDSSTTACTPPNARSTRSVVATD